MKITDALLGEHGVFYVLFHHLETPAAKDRIPDGPRDGAALLSEGLITHARLEDELLFAALEPHLGSRAGPLAVMRLEHQEIEEGLARLQKERDPAAAQTLLDELLRLTPGVSA